MIAAVDLAMTIGAAPIIRKNRWTHRRRQLLERPRRGRVPDSNMTLGAQPRIAYLQKPVVDRAVRFMTVGAIFQRRRMFPEKRPAPFSMTGIAIFIDASLFELRWIGASVRVMTVGTDHLAFSERHVRRAKQLCLPL